VIISDIQNPFFTSVISGIEKALESTGDVLLLCDSDEDAKLYSGLLEKRVVIVFRPCFRSL
jgi:DNA-binding LacI/PurR family transcriptional regulator